MPHRGFCSIRSADGLVKRRFSFAIALSILGMFMRSQDLLLVSFGNKIGVSVETPDHFTLDQTEEPLDRWSR